MCGRYASTGRPEDLAAHFGVAAPPEEHLAPSFNVAPTARVYIVRADEAAGRELRVVRWGLVPSWAKEAKVGARHINARAETLATTPAYRSAYRRRRCLVPADGYYEWQPAGGRKQPFYLCALDGAPLAMAGLYEVWRPPAGAGDPLWTCTVVTTSAPDEHADLHERTPMLVPAEHWAQWLDPQVTEPDDLLVPGAPGVLDAWPVGSAVGNVRNDGPALRRPVDLAPVQPHLL